MFVMDVGNLLAMWQVQRLTKKRLSTIRTGLAQALALIGVVIQEAWDEQVLVSAAWDEQVLVKDAWDETITTGYKCSGCGATK